MKLSHLIASAALLTGCIVQTQTSSDPTGDGGGGSGGEAGATPGEDTSVLFVVNNSGDLTSYAGATRLDGELEPTTRLTSGAPTSLYKAREAALTDSGRLLVARQNDAINGYDDGRTVTGDAPATVIVEGPSTLLTTPTSIAYTGDRVYVGVAPASEGILVFEGVSSPAFDGDVAPTRAFGPPDRAPHDADGTIPMAVDALALDGAGGLWISDASADHVNQSRILVYESPGTLEGAAAPDRVLTNRTWGRIDALAVDAHGNLYLVTGDEKIFRVEGAAGLDGEVEPVVIGLQVDRPSLQGIAISEGGMALVADTQNFAIYSIDGVASAAGDLVPSRTLTGYLTGLRSPRKLFLLEP
jgi:hypothetical protein